MYVSVFNSFSLTFSAFPFLFCFCFVLYNFLPFSHFRPLPFFFHPYGHNFEMFLFEYLFLFGFDIYMECVFLFIMKQSYTRLLLFSCFILFFSLGALKDRFLSLVFSLILHFFIFTSKLSRYCQHFLFLLSLLFPIFPVLFLNDFSSLPT